MCACPLQSEKEPQCSLVRFVLCGLSLEVAAFRIGYFGLVARLFAGLAGSLLFFKSYKRMIAAAAA